MPKLLVFLLLLAILPVHALDLEYYKFTNNPTYSITEDAQLKNGVIPSNYPFILTAALDYVRTPLSVKIDDERVDDVVKSLLGLHLGGGFKVTDKLFLGARTYLTQVDSGNNDKGVFLGDSIIEAKYRFYQSKHAAWALHPRLTIPTGSQDFTTNNKKTGGYLGLNFEKRFSWLQAVFNLGYSHQPGAHLGLGTEYSIINYKESIYTAIGSIIPVSERWAVNLEAYRFNQFKGNQHPNELYVGLRNQTTKNVASFMGISVGGPIDQSSNDYRLSLGIKYTPFEDKVIEAAPVVAPKPAPAPTKREKILSREQQIYGNLKLAENIYFANNSIVLTEVSQGILKKVRDLLKSIKGKGTIVLEGFASTRGNNPAYNMELSKKRSIISRDFLQKLGVSPSEMQLVAYGDAKADPHLDEGLNIKVMIRFYEKK